MSDSPLHLAREAKGLHHALKDLLKTHSPWDRQVEFGRKNLRSQYLRLLLLEPYATESRDAETHLWMQTSYHFIAHYKQSLATLERTLQSAPHPQKRQPTHGPVEYRKLIQRFRQFLSDEEKFWTQFIVRYQRSFALHVAYSALVALNILTPSDDANLPNIPDPATADGASHHNHPRNDLLFPPDENTPPPDPAQHDSRLAILSKAIVCLGDIARYRELYNEARGRPKAGHEDGTVPAKRGSRGGRGGIPGLDSISRARNYDKAIQCYEHARLLVPHDGNSSHQLAILAFYQGDMFNSLLHYHRALCVRQPYDTASENVKKILNKALDQQSKKSRDSPASSPDSGQVPPRLRVDHLKENVVLLHALWRLGSDKININPIAHADLLAKEFQSLVSERILPIEMVSKVVVLSHGALWIHRMIRDTSASSKRSSRLPDSCAIESHILTHIITIHRTLLEIGTAELDVPPEDTAENDLAQRITAPFRRTLPALRLASKWLVANIRYVLHAAQPTVGEQRISTGKGTPGALIQGLPLFWAKFAQFYSALNGIFPSERLPPLTAPLDEDIDLKGFLPLRDLLVDRPLADPVPGIELGAQQNGTPSHVREKVHPNEEQLMRIWDLLTDARLLAELETCPIHLHGHIFSFDNAPPIFSSGDIHELHVPDQISQCVTQDGLRRENELQDDAMTDTGRIDDDPVRDAFRKALDDLGAVDDEDDGEVILYNPRPLGSPLAPLATVLPATPVLRTATAEDVPTAANPPNAIAPGRAAPKSLVVVPGTTAQDLLNNVMGPKRGAADASHPPPPSSAVAQFPFGLGPNAPPSIWSTSLDQGSPPSPSFSSPSLGLRGDVNVRQVSPSLPSQHSWSPQFESTQTGRLAPQPSSRFQPPPAVNSEHHPSTSLPFATPQHVPQPIFQTLGNSMAPVAEGRQLQRANAYNIPFTDPAVVSVVAASPRTIHQGRASFQEFSNDPAQRYTRSGLRHPKSPSTARIWGIHG